MPDLKVIIKEELEIDGTPQGGQWEKIYTGIENVYKSYGYIPLGTEVNLYTTDSNTWAGSNLENDGTKYIRITNLYGNGTGSADMQVPYSGIWASVSESGTGNVMRLRLSGSIAGVSWHSIAPGDSFIITRHTSSYRANDDYDTNTPNYYGLSFADIDSVDAMSQGNPCSYYIFAAGVETT